MSTTKIAIERAREKAKSRQGKVSNLAAEIEDALEEIVAARAEGLTLQDLATEMSVPLKRLSEAVIRAQRKRVGLTSSGKPRKVGPPEYVSASAKAFEASLSSDQAPAQPAPGAIPVMNPPQPATPQPGRYIMTPAARERHIAVQAQLVIEDE